MRKATVHFLEILADWYDGCATCVVVDSYDEKSSTWSPNQEPLRLSYDVVEYRALDRPVAPAGSTCVGKGVPWDKEQSTPYATGEASGRALKGWRGHNVDFGAMCAEGESRRKPREAGAYPFRMQP